MRALVTGSEGFIGRHFARHLASQGWSVTPIDVREPHHVPTLMRDARDFFRLSPSHYDLVIHAAAVVGGRKTIEHSPLDQAVDLELDAALFAWARRSNPGTVVYFSSSAAYPVALQGEPWANTLGEDEIDLYNPELPDELYGWIKLTGERLANLYRPHGRVIVARPFSGYGPDQDLTYPFPAMVARAVAREDPFEVWGTGRQVRDFVHVDDIVGAVMAAYELGVDGPFNIGSGDPTTMVELAAMVSAVAGYTPTITALDDSDHPHGVGYRVCDPTYLHTFYRPQITLKEGIQQALAA